MIDKLFGRDSIEEQVEEPVEEPAEEMFSPIASSVPNMEIKGIWAGKAGDYDPKPEITISDQVAKIFYRIESSGRGFGEFRHTTKVYVNGRLVRNENGTIKEGDPTDTGVISVPSFLKEPGMVGKIVINIKSWDGNTAYVSPEFRLNVQ